MTGPKQACASLSCRCNQSHVVAQVCVGVCVFLEYVSAQKLDVWRFRMGWMLSHFMHIVTCVEREMNDWLNSCPHIRVQTHIYTQGHALKHALTCNVVFLSWWLENALEMKPSHLCCLFIGHTVAVINQMLIKLLNNNFCLLQETSALLGLMYVVQYEGELLRGFTVSCYPIKKVFPPFFPLLTHYQMTI